MIEAIMRAIWSGMVQDSDLASRLSKYPTGSNSPAIFSGYAPQGAQMPFIVMRVDTATPEETDATERMVLTMDTFTSGWSSAPVLAIRQRAERLIANLATANDVPVLATFRESAGMVPEDEPGVQHLNQRFVIRYGRSDLYE